MSQFDNYPTTTNTSIHAWGVTQFYGEDRSGYMVLRIGSVADIYLSSESATRMLSALQEGIAALAAQEEVA